MIEEIAERIKSLPPLPKSLTQIEAIFRNPNASINQLAAVIEEDPMLVANLLKAANSPLYGFRKEIRSVLQAASLFGMKNTRSLVIDMSIKKPLNVDLEPYNITPEGFAQLSSMQSALITHWYQQINPAALDTLFLAALLQETGKILIADEVMKNDESYLFKTDIQTATSVAHVERSFVGMSSAEITALIFEHWKFDTVMVESIRHSDDYDAAPPEYRANAFALKVVKTAVAINAPLSDRNIMLALGFLKKEGMDETPFIRAVETLKSYM